MGAVVVRPVGLKEAGGRLWDEITGEFDLRSDELRVLEDACREADLVDRLEGELATSDLVVRGSMGQPVASPLVQEIRQHRTTFKALVSSLKLPDDPGTEAEKAKGRSTTARAAAQARWQQRGA